MPLRGENIGAAYIRVYVDGEEVPEGIREALDDAEPSVREGGREHGKQYGAEFNSQVNKSFKGNFGKSKKDILQGLNEGLTESLARLELSDRFFASSDWRKFRSRLTEEYGDAGTLAGKRLEERFRDSTDLDGLVGEMKRIGPQVRKAQVDLVAEMNDDLLRQEREMLTEAYDMNRAFDRRRRQLLEEAYRENRDFDRRVAREREEMLWEAYWTNRQFDLREAHAKRKALDEQREMLAEAYQMNRDYDARRRTMLEEAYRLNREYDRRQRRMLEEAYWMNRDYDQKQAKIDRDRVKRLREIREEYRDLLDMLRKVERGEHSHTVSMRRLNQQLSEMRRNLAELGEDDHLGDDLDRIGRRIRTTHPLVTRLNRGFDQTAGAMGLIMGKGSRNNFLNFLGSMVANIAKLVFLVPKLALKVGTELGDAFKEAGGGMAGVFASGSRLAGMLGSTAAGLVVVAAGFAALVAILGPVVALFSGLLGIVAALASTISFALVGALGVLIGLLGVAGGGLAVLITGLTNLPIDRIQKQTRSLRNEWSDFADEIGRTLAEDVPRQAAMAESVLERLRPVALRIADALRVVASKWLDALDSPAFQKFLDRIETFMPEALRKLGDIIGQTLGGLGGIFTGAIPMMREFLGWLEEITERFSQWANSPEGQQQIRDFFEDVSESAKALWGFLGEVWDLLREILGAGKDTGDSIFTSMADAVERFTTYLQENPEALEQWFEDARELASSIGDALIGLGKIIDILDNPTNRKIIRKMLDAFTATAFAIAFMVEKADKFLDKIGLIGDILSKPFDLIFDLPNPGAMLSAAIRVVTRIGRALPSLTLAIGVPSVGVLAGKFAGLAPKILGRIGKINLFDIFKFPSLASIAARFVGLGLTIFNRMGRITLYDAFKFPGLASIAAHFTGLSVMILGRIGFIDLDKNIMYPSLDSIASHFGGLAGKILGEIGTIDLGSLITFPNDIPGVPGMATGGIADGPMLRWIGEAGAEAVVPLDRPLSQVDPAVRALSAIAQGISVPGMSGGQVPSKSVDASNWTIVSASEDPRAVAAEVLNSLMAQAY